MRGPLRFLTWLGLLGAVAGAQADRLIDVPTARKVPTGVIRYEVSSERDARRAVAHRLAYGIDPYFDVELRSSVPFEWSRNATFDLAYQFVGPVPGISPGISLALRDGLNETEDGRALVVAFTFREAFYTMNGEVNGDVTLGVDFGRSSALLIATSIPFSREVFLLAEHDSRRLHAGIEFRPIRPLSIRATTRENRGTLSLSWTQRL